MDGPFRLFNPAFQLCCLVLLTIILYAEAKPFFSRLEEGCLKLETSPGYSPTWYYDWTIDNTYGVGSYLHLKPHTPLVPGYYDYKSVPVKAAQFEDRCIKELMIAKGKVQGIWRTFFGRESFFTPWPSREPGWNKLEAMLNSFRHILGDSLLEQLKSETRRWGNVLEQDADYLPARFSFSTVRIERQIASATNHSAQVFLVKPVGSTGPLTIAKVYDPYFFDTSEFETSFEPSAFCHDQYTTEASVYNTITHKVSGSRLVPEFYGTYEAWVGPGDDKRPVYILLNEFIHGTELRSRAALPKDPTDDEAKRRVIKAAIKADELLLSIGISHEDIYPRNFILRKGTAAEEDPEVVIIDFGMVNNINEYDLMNLTDIVESRWNCPMITWRFASSGWVGPAGPPVYIDQEPAGGLLDYVEGKTWEVPNEVYDGEASPCYAELLEP